MHKRQPMELPGVEVILSWPLPNYDDPVTRDDALVIVNSALIRLVMIVVLLRLYSRLYVRRWFGLDDVFIIVALVCVES